MILSINSILVIRRNNFGANINFIISKIVKLLDFNILTKFNYLIFFYYYYLRNYILD